MKKASCKIMHYTIVEMMMVVAVFMIILSMSMVAWLNSGQQAKLKNAARQVSAMLNLAKAKAVTGREPVRVEFTDAGRIELFYGESGTEKPHDVNPVYLPKNTMFIEDKGEEDGKPKLYSDGNSVQKTTPAPIIFTATGKLKNDDTGKRLYLIGECPDGKAQGSQSYYIITVNQFTGRINTIQETVKD